MEGKNKQMFLSCDLLINITVTKRSMNDKMEKKFCNAFRSSKGLLQNNVFLLIELYIYMGRERMLAVAIYRKKR